MNCRNIEEKIYLHAELTASEKAIVDEHISQCDSCGKLAQQVFYAQSVIKNAAIYKPELSNPHRLTHRVMNAIENEQRQSVFSRLADYLDHIFIRYALGVASILLISFFIYEQQVVDFSPPMSSSIKSEIKSGSVLDYGKFRNTYTLRKERRPTTIQLSRYSYYKSNRLKKIE